MAINQKDIKLLWGRSGNRCAKCRTHLTQDKAAVSAAFTLGEQAHIVGEQDDAARGNSQLATDERNSYHNLILLCPTCHTEVDKNEDDWPVEKLHTLKSQHELWVTETLNETVDHVKLAQGTAVAAIIDAAVSLCDLEHWRAWTSSALSPDPSWSQDQIDNVYTFRQRLVGAIWPPEFEEFRRAAVTLAVLLHKASEKFMEHSQFRKPDRWEVVKFYKLIDPNPSYDADVVRYEAWLDECYKLIYLSTKAANWFADVVRRDVNPLFFMERGYFLVEEGPFSDLSWRTTLLQFTDEEKVGYPDEALAV